MNRILLVLTIVLFASTFIFSVDEETIFLIKDSNCSNSTIINSCSTCYDNNTCYPEYENTGITRDKEYVSFDLSSIPKNARLFISGGEQLTCYLNDTLLFEENVNASNFNTLYNNKEMNVKMDAFKTGENILRCTFSGSGENKFDSFKLNNFLITFEKPADPLCYNPPSINDKAAGTYISENWEKALPYNGKIDNNYYDYIVFPGGQVTLKNNGLSTMSYISSGGAVYEKEPFFAFRIGDYGSGLEHGFYEALTADIDLRFLIDMSVSYKQERSVLNKYWDTLLETVESQKYQITAKRYWLGTDPDIVKGYPSGYTRLDDQTASIEAWGGHGANVMESISNSEENPVRFMIVLADNIADGGNGPGSEHQKHINDFIQAAKDKNVNVYFMYDGLERSGALDDFREVSDAIGGKIFKLSDRVDQLTSIIGEEVIDKTAELRSDITSNSVGGETSLKTNKRYCNSSGLPGQKIGYGISSTITKKFNDVNLAGGHDYLTQFMKKPIGGTYGAEGRTQENASGSFFFSNPVSVLAFSGPTENKFLEDTKGKHVQPITFTVLSKSYTDVNIINYEITCEAGVECELDSDYKGYVIDNENDRLIIPGTVSFEKDLPKTIIYDINLEYTLPELSAFKDYEHIYKTSANPVKLKFGLIDKQDFRVKMIAETGTGNCLASDGTVGQTGPEIAPKINLEFGGAVGDEGLISVDECDTTTINKEAKDWVYCTQEEFLVELVRKAGEIVRLQNKIDNEINDAKLNNRKINQDFVDSKHNEINNYRLSEVNFRELKLDIENISESINNLPIDLFEDIGLEYYNDVGLRGNKNELKEQALKILQNTQFILQINNIASQTTSYSPGKYSMEVNVNLDKDYQSKDLIYMQNEEYVPNYNIEVEFERESKPSYDWFFYDFGAGNSLDESINIETSYPFNKLNNGEENGIDRGTVFSFSQNKETSKLDLENAKLYNSTAHPIFVKFGKYDNQLHNSFNINHPEADDLSGTLGYWTAFASNKGNGCKSINPNLNSLSYYTPDSISIVDGSPAQTVSLEDIYNTALQNNSIEYMHGVIYLPKDIGETNYNQLTLSGDTEIYSISKNNLDNGTLTLKPQDNDFVVSDLQTLFNRIKDESICVNRKIYTNETNWTLFWNEEKILSKLNNQKRNINDATICPNRQIN